MEHLGKPGFNPLDLLTWLSGRDHSLLNSDNYPAYLKFNLSQERMGLTEPFALENNASYYIGNQIARLEPGVRIILADGKRRTIPEIINQWGPPAAVWMTSISSNFPTAVVAAIALNYGKIPVFLGGIHVSSCPEDVNLFIRAYAPFPALISQIYGPGDSEIIGRLLQDLHSKTLKPEYNGKVTIEDGIWGSSAVQELPDMKLYFFKELPLVGRYLYNRLHIKGVAPFLGCPYACNFCSASASQPNHKKFTARSAADFFAQLQTAQKNGWNLSNRFWLFLPDNILLGGQRLVEMLDLIIVNHLQINFAVQVSIEIANHPHLLKKLRQAGVIHFFIGFESLHIQDLELIGKHVVKEIKKSGLTLKSFYAEKIRIIQDHGINIHGAFIFGLPHQHFHSLEDHSGREVADFCIQNHIGIQVTSLNDLPGSANFSESQKKGHYLYGQKGSMDYLLSLCTADLIESNCYLPQSLWNSPLVVVYMAHYAAKKVCSARNCISSGLYMVTKSWGYPSGCGRRIPLERLFDLLGAVGFQIAAGAYLDQLEAVMYSGENRCGVFERLYRLEKNPALKKIFKNLN